MAELATTALFSDSALLSYWRFEGNSNDSKGSNNGTDTTVTYSTANGKYGQGAGYNGTSSKTRTANNPFSNANLATATIVFWFKLASAPAANAHTLNIEGWVTAWLNTSGYVECKSSGGDGDLVTYSTNICDGAWHHVAFKWNSTTSSELYVDNVSRGTHAPSGAPNVDSTTRPMGIGASWQDANWFGGAIDDMAVFSKGLSATEINTLYSDATGHRLSVLGAGN